MFCIESKHKSALVGGGLYERHSFAVAESGVLCLQCLSCNRDNHCIFSLKRNSFISPSLGKTEKVGISLE